MRLELRAIGPGKAGTIRLPEKGGDWIDLQVR